MALAEHQRIINVVRNAVVKFLKSGARIDFVKGVVDVSDGTTADVFIDGNEESSEGFRVPAGMYVNTGDNVVCAIDYGSNLGRWVAHVIPSYTFAKISLNPNTGEVLTSDGETTPEPLELGGGTVTDGVDNHVADPDPHPDYLIESRVRVLRGQSIASIGANSGADSIHVWPTTFADSNYSVFITPMLDENVQPPHFMIRTKTPSQVTIRVYNNSANAKIFTIDLLAIHD